jgi:hypothetical protein
MVSNKKAMLGLATAVLLAFTAQAHAGGASCSKSSKGEVKHTAKDGSTCLASSDGTGKAKAKATGGGSSQTFVTSGGKSNSVASDQATSEAESETDGKSTAHASGAGSDAFVDADQKGVATVNATGGSTANVTALGNCNATGMATGGSTVNANCEADGSFVHATATGGGEADGSDSSPPTCTPNGGTARVRSSGGNCG